MNTYGYIEDQEHERLFAPTGAYRVPKEGEFFLPARGYADGTAPAVKMVEEDGITTFNTPRIILREVPSRKDVTMVLHADVPQPYNPCIVDSPYDTIKSLIAGQVGFQVKFETRLVPLSGSERLEKAARDFFHAHRDPAVDVKLYPTGGLDDDFNPLR